MDDAYSSFGLVTLLPLERVPDEDEGEGLGLLQVLPDLIKGEHLVAGLGHHEEVVHVRVQLPPLHLQLHPAPAAAAAAPPETGQQQQVPLPRTGAGL